jgi:uncharacterized protein YjeT (DUF2065 family)
MIGSIGPGLALLIAPHRWASSPLFQQISHLPIHFQIIGLFLIVASLLVLFVKKQRDLGYTLIAIFYLLMNISAGFAIFDGRGTSALIFALPVLLWLYLEAAITATRDELLDVCSGGRR